MWTVGAKDAWGLGRTGPESERDPDVWRRRPRGRCFREGRKREAKAERGRGCGASGAGL